MSDSEDHLIVFLAESQTHVVLPYGHRDKAIQAAHRVCLSLHERTWTQEEQERMATYCLWACQRLDAIAQVAMGRPLVHASKTGL